MPEIRDRIHDLLKRAGLPLPATRILQEALNICFPNHLAAEKVLGADVYYLVRGLFVGRTPVKLGVPAPKKMQTKIHSLYFSNRNVRARRREPWETELISRWLGSNRQRLNWVDVDHAGSYETTLRRLNSYLTDPDRLSAKVFYR